MMQSKKYPVQEIRIGEKEISEYVIVCPQNAELCLEEAIQTMTETIENACGCRLSCISETEESEYEIVIGNTSRESDVLAKAKEKIQYDGYAIVADKNRLFITGNIDRGTCYGIYGFLETYLGVRFYAEDYTVIHEAEKVQIPKELSVVENPGFRFRDINWHSYLYNPQLAMKNKVNISQGKWRHDRKQDFYAGAYVHTFAALSGEEAGHDSPQPCLSDDKVYQKVLTNVKLWLKEHPTASIISVSQNDDSSNFCKCEKCRALEEQEGTPMGPLLHFINRIGRDIQEEHPQVLVDTLAYIATRKPPKQFIPADNVAIRLCSMGYCFSHPLSGENCAINKEFREEMEGWAKVAKHLHIWDYTTNFWYYLTPFPNLHVLWDNVQFFKKNHVEHLHEQGNNHSKSGEFEELRVWLLAKLLWNPDMTREEYLHWMDEFLQDYYGEGWQYIREYIDRTTEKAAEVPKNDAASGFDIIRNSRGHLNIYADPDTILLIRNEEGEVDLTFAHEMTQLWDKAQEAASKSIYKEHIKKSRLQDEYYNLYSYFDGQEERCKQFYQHLQKCGITSIAEELHRLPNITDFTISPKEWKKMQWDGRA